MIQMYASASVAGYAMILARHVAMIRARPNYHAAHRSSKSIYEMMIKSWEVDVAWQCISERL